MNTLTLTANPGGPSRKYALYRGETKIAEVHFVYQEGLISCTTWFEGQQQRSQTDFYQLGESARHVVPALTQLGALRDNDRIGHIGLRLAIPSSYFLRDHELDDGVVGKLRDLQPRAPIHIAAVLQEIEALQQTFPRTPLVGISDSAFHSHKPDYAWNYGVRLQDADRFNIKRFGFHGLSVGSVVRRLQDAEKLPPNVIVVHLGNDGSVTAVHGGKSLDTTMGYSPLDGLISATRVGSIDPTAANVLQSHLHLTDEQMEDYLNNHSGLLGLSELSRAVEELLEYEAHGNHRAELALQTYIFAIQKAIGAMSTAMAGADMIVFTGTVGERSAAIRRRIVDRLHFMDFLIDDEANDACSSPTGLTLVSKLAHSKPVYVIPTDESGEIIERLRPFRV